MILSFLQEFLDKSLSVNEFTHIQSMEESELNRSAMWLVIIDNYSITNINIIKALIYFSLCSLLKDAIDSEMILAAKYAVILLSSKSGDSSTISIAMIPVWTACLTRYRRSMLDKPPGEGTETPGANAGSRQSRSMEIYFF
jgi:Zn-dependent M16 (insulinase) family peptidase